MMLLHRMASSVAQGSLLAKRAIPAGLLGRPLNLTPDRQVVANVAYEYRPAAGYNTSAPTASAPAYDNAAAASNGAMRVSTDYGIYKKSSAMNVKMLPPTWGVKGNTRVLERQGTMLLEFAHVNNTAPQGGGPGRTYDWQNKHYFALSPMELGSVLAAAPGETLKFFHDPAKLGKAGDAMKTLQINPGSDGSVFFAISAGAQDRINVPVTRAELEVFKSLANYAIPRLLGFDAVFSS